MKRIWVFLSAGLFLAPQIAMAQNTDCNQLARDFVVKNYTSSWSDYSKLLFLFSLTQMDLKTSKEALDHSGQVGVGPISIGPGTWNSEKQNQLRSDLQKIVNVEQLRESAASVSLYSGDPGAAQVVQDCLGKTGGLFVGLHDLGPNNAVIEMQWTPFPAAGNSATIDNVTVIHGKIMGGANWAKSGAKLNARLPQRITVKRDDPKLDLAAIVNTANAGSAQAYLPPKELPPPPKMIRDPIEGTQVEVGSGGRYDGDRNPGCQRHELDSCVTPKHGGTIVPGSGKPKTIAQSGNAGAINGRESPQEYCITFWANTGACETPVYIKGVATAIEEYPADK